ncbi:hypothetical protein LCGC14_0937040 [marine sediment metagenome]|uniref:Peptidase S74 domain-containing protein n=1 Tax=marine sediment metagenome TaxID=412755 RepID=A0A0F9P7C5_9ZZZZ
MKFSFFFIFLFILFISLVGAEVDIGEENTIARGVNILPPDTKQIIFSNNTGAVNSSEFWITNIGSLGDVNSTQFSNNGGFLNILESWVRGLAVNPFDQDLNTTSNVNFTNLNLSGNLLVGGGFIGTPLDQNLLEFVSGELDINGDLLVTGTAFADIFKGGDFVTEGDVNIYGPSEGILFFNATAGADITDITFDLDGIRPRIFSTTDAIIEFDEAVIVTDSLTVEGNLQVDEDTFFVASSSNRVAIGTTTPADDFNLVKSSNLGIRMEVYSDTGTDRPIFRLLHAGGTEASPTATQDGDRLGEIQIGGWDTAISLPKTIGWTASAEWGTSGDTTDNPFSIGLFTVPDGSSSATERIRIQSDGLVGIGISSPSHLLTVDGLVNVTTLGSATSNTLCTSQASGGILSDCTSASKYKENVVDLDVTDSLWDRIMNLNPVSFDFIDNPGRRNLGLIAENVEEEFPNFVFYKDIPTYAYNNVSYFDEELEENVTINNNRTIISVSTELEGFNYRQDLTTLNLALIQDLKTENTNLKDCILNGGSLVEIQTCVAGI